MPYCALEMELKNIILHKKVVYNSGCSRPLISKYESLILQLIQLPSVCMLGEIQDAVWLLRIISKLEISCTSTLHNLYRVCFLVLNIGSGIIPCIALSNRLLPHIASITKLYIIEHQTIL